MGRVFVVLLYFNPLPPPPPPLHTHKQTTPQQLPHTSTQVSVQYQFPTQLPVCQSLVSTGGSGNFQHMMRTGEQHAINYHAEKKPRRYGQAWGISVHQERTRLPVHEKQTPNYTLPTINPSRLNRSIDFNRSSTNLPLSDFRGKCSAFLTSFPLIYRLR